MTDSSSSDAEDFGDFADFLGTDEYVPVTRTCSGQFWSDLKNQALGPNTLGDIVLMDEFGADKQLQDPGMNNGGLRYACVTKSGTGNGYFIRGSLTPCCGKSVPVYWIPWKTGVTVYAERAWFENSICEYMITSQLSGCRFVVTERHVLHVASNAYGALDGIGGSKRRDEAERLVTGGAESRRLSFSKRHGDLAAYKTRALAFGIRYETGWKYKALSNKTNGGTAGSWVTLVG